MKIQCDVCHKGEATVFCPADEAALCDGCDNSIHHANKLAGKHARFSLIHPSLKELPICDICQERRAFLFCKEDRAILCRECDIPIHKANEHTQKHDRFLLTGVKLHASSSLYPTSTSSNGSEANIDTEIRNPESSSRKRPDTFSNELFLSSPSGNANPTASKVEENQINDSTASISTSSISEYLMETLPGWRVEDLLDPAFPANGICKNFDQSLPLVDQDLERNMGFFSTEDSAIWIPHEVLPQFHLFPQTDFLNGSKEWAKTTDVKVSSRKWSDHDGFTVPQISPPSLKKLRRFR